MSARGPAELATLILCGGLGTRLASVTGNATPKVLAPVAGRPFLDLLVDSLRAAGLRRFVLLAGHLADQVERHVATTLRAAHADCTFDLSVEPAPLGTGGAIAHAARFVDGTFAVVNGDTWCAFDAAALLAAHRRHEAILTIGAARVADAGRYGALHVDGAALRGFREKGHAGPGLVNAGVYLCEAAILPRIPAGRFVSLEQEVLPALLAGGARIGVAEIQEFVDIGTAESHAAFAARQGAHTA